MIRTIAWVSWLNLRRDRFACAIVFLLPIGFFSIFATIFGHVGGGDGTEGGPSFQSLAVLAVDEDRTEASKALLRALDRLDEIDLIQFDPEDGSVVDPPRDVARMRVRQGDYDAALVIPAGFREYFPDFTGEGPEITLVYDAANPMARPTIIGLAQASAMTAMPDLMMERGFEALEQVGWYFTDDQRHIMTTLKEAIRGETEWRDLGSESNDVQRTEQKPRDGAAVDTNQPANSSSPPTTSTGALGLAGILRIDATEARAVEQNKEDAEPFRQRTSIISYYAAGIGVMFLLFSMAGASASLLEEEELGTLERLLTCSGSITTVLLGNWLFYVALGFAQLAIMFIWAALVFGLDLWTVNHVAGFLGMTLVTSMAAGGFGIMLAAVCRSRAQLNGISTIIILIMSALGGSMFPRFIMPQFMKTTSLFTFNGWALDGYLKVFWYDDPSHSVTQSLLSLTPQLGMLFLMTTLFLGIARLLARRWESI